MVFKKITSHRRRGIAMTESEKDAAYHRQQLSDILQNVTGIQFLSMSNTKLITFHASFFEKERSQNLCCVHIQIDTQIVSKNSQIVFSLFRKVSIHPKTEVTKFLDPNNFLTFPKLLDQTVRKG